MSLLSLKGYKASYTDFCAAVRTVCTLDCSPSLLPMLRDSSDSTIETPDLTICPTAVSHENINILDSGFRSRLRPVQFCQQQAAGCGTCWVVFTDQAHRSADWKLSRIPRSRTLHPNTCSSCYEMYLYYKTTCIVSLLWLSRKSGVINVGYCTSQATNNKLDGFINKRAEFRVT